MNHGILAVVTDAQRVNLNLAFASMGMGPSAFIRSCTTDPNPTTVSPPTHWLMYDASAQAGDALAYETAILGTLPTTFQGNACLWDDLISSADALTAFAAMQFWLNSSDLAPSVFRDALMATAGLKFVPDET